MLRTGRVPPSSGFAESGYSRHLVGASKTWKEPEANEQSDETRRLDPSTKRAGFSVRTKGGRLSCAVYRVHYTVTDSTGAVIDPSWLGDYGYKVAPGLYGSLIEERLGPACVLRPVEGAPQVLDVADERIAARGIPAVGLS